MKKAIILVLLCNIIFAQEKNNDTINKTGKNEIKLNAFYLALNTAELNYEYLLNSNSALGIAFAIPYENSYEGDLNYLITTYYRQYFGNKYASGFFIEGLGMFIDEDCCKNFTLGGSIGSKFMLDSNVIIELYFGLGNSLTNRGGLMLGYMPRLGISIGRRF